MLMGYIHSIFINNNGHYLAEIALKFYRAKVIEESKKQ